jgi:hypothetical protein
MANIDLTVQDISRAGLDANDQGSLSISDTYFVPNDGRVFLHFKKSGAGIANITFDTPGTVDGVAIANPVVQVPATTGDIMVGPFRPETFNDPTTGKMSFTSDNITGLTVARLRLP